MSGGVFLKGEEDLCFGVAYEGSTRRYVGSVKHCREGALVSHESSMF